MVQARPKISIIVPAHNEEASIVACVEEIKRTMEEHARDYEIVVIDDGSTDLTHQKLLEAFNADSRVKVSSHKPNQGKGYAIREGFKLCSGELIGFIDADLDLHPSHLLLLESYLQLKDADVAIGSKRHPDSVLCYPWIRKLYSNVYYILVKLLFGLPVKDTQTGVKLFKRKALEHVAPMLAVNRYAFDLELLALLNRAGYRIVEAPIKLNFSRRYAGRIGIRDIWNTLSETVVIFRRLRTCKEGRYAKK